MKSPALDEKIKPVKVGQTSIKIYRTKRGEHQFRYYLAGKALRVTRVELSEIIKEAKQIATDIENGRAQAGAITAADAQSLSHARRLLGPDDPPVHAIVEEWVRLKARTGGAAFDDLAVMWERSRPKGAAALDPEASRVESLKTHFLLTIGNAARHSGSKRNVTSFRHDLTRFCLDFGRRKLAEISTDEIEIWIRGLGVGARRQDNLRAELVTFFRFARDRGHLPDDRRTEPEKVPKVYKASGDVSFYTPSEMRAFLAAVKPRWLPWLALGAFAGMRSSEIGRIEWSAFDWKARLIRIPGSVALKKRKARRVPIADNLFAWLRPWHGATGRLYDLRDPLNAWARYTRLRLSKAAKLTWRNNDLRHSYGTYQMALLNNHGQVATWMGNSEAKVKSNYDGVSTPAQADEWFSIAPDEDAEGKVIVMQKA